ncbi:MAG: NAD(P)/FAD-dependent oxidoreductase, partial [Actinomycetes bacterium]
RLGTAAIGLDLGTRTVTLAGGGTEPFDRLVIATGAHPRLLPTVPTGPGVHVLRTYEDAIGLHTDLQHRPRVAIIGAGFIGLEVAASCRQLGLDVTVVEALDVPLERAIGAEMGRVVVARHRSRGVRVELGVGVAGLERSGRANGPVEAIRLEDGRSLPADLVVVGVGVSPTTGWLTGSGLDLADGVRCDSQLRAQAGGRAVPGVVAAGDVARWHHPAYGGEVRIEHWTNAAEQGEAAARTLMEGASAPAFAPVPYFWSDQLGLKLQFLGRALPGDQVTVIDGELDAERWAVAYGRDGRLVAALGSSRPGRVMKLRAAIGAGAPYPPGG